MMTMRYEQWLRATEQMIRSDCQEVWCLLANIRTMKRQWRIPTDLEQELDAADRLAARAQAVHRAWQALVAAELDAEALVRSYMAVLHRLDRGERPFTLADEDTILPEPEPLRLD